jgi:hypothetical protein
MDNSVMDNASEMNQTQVEPPIQATEKMVPQSQVNEIVGSAKREAAEKAVEAYKRQNSPTQEPQAQDQNYRRGVSEDDITRVTDDRIKQHFSKIEQEAQERANAEAANRIVGMFRDKIVAGKEKFEDFESVTGNVAMQYYPNVVQLLAEHVDNTADVLYHLAKNRDKLYRLESLSSHNSSDAIYEIKRLADSIKANSESSQMKNPNAPLSQQRPSNTGTDSGAVLSMSDLKRKYRG